MLKIKNEFFSAFTYSLFADHTNTIVLVEKIKVGSFCLFADHYTNTIMLSEKLNFVNFFFYILLFPSILT